MKIGYNIHNIFKFNIESKKQSYLNNVYSYFKTNIIKNPDMNIILNHKFIIPKNGFKNINKRFFISKNKIYFEDSHKFSQWRALIENLESNKLNLVLGGNILFSERFLYRFIVEPIIQYKLVQKGYSFVHSSSVGGKKAHVFVSLPGVGKTSIAMNLVREGYEFFGDDFIILYKNKVYSYPTSVRLLDYNMKTCPFLWKKIKNKEKLFLTLKSLLRIFSLNKIKLPQDIDVKQITNKVGKSKEIGSVNILRSSKNSKVKIKKITKREAIRKIILINKPEFERFSQCLEIYSRMKKGLPNYWRLQKKNLSKLNAKYYEIYIPKKYGKITLQRIMNNIGE